MSLACHARHFPSLDMSLACHGHACPLIRKMVRGGNLGVKTGKGFYVYNADRTKTPVDAQ